MPVPLARLCGATQARLSLRTEMSQCQGRQLLTPRAHRSELELDACSLGT